MHQNFDAILGGKLLALRKQQSISLAEMAAEIGVSYQQMQKYEAGKNSLSVWRLTQLCKLLKSDPRDFLDAGDCLPHTLNRDDDNSLSSAMNLIGERTRLRNAYFSLSLETRLAFLRLLEATAPS